MILVMILTIVRYVSHYLGIRSYHGRVISNLLTPINPYLCRVRRRVKLGVTLLIATDMWIIRNLSIGLLLIINGGRRTLIISYYGARHMSRMRRNITHWSASIK